MTTKGKKMRYSARLSYLVHCYKNVYMSDTGEYLIQNFYWHAQVLELGMGLERKWDSLPGLLISVVSVTAETGCVLVLGQNKLCFATSWHT